MDTGYESYNSDPDGLFKDVDESPPISPNAKPVPVDSGSATRESRNHDEDNHDQEMPPLLKLDPLAFTHFMCFLHESDLFNLERVSYTANVCTIQNRVWEKTLYKTHRCILLR